MNDQVEKLRRAFEHENRIRNKVVKAVSAVTGISEKYLVQEKSAEVAGRLKEWVKDLKRAVKKQVPELEDEIERLRVLLEEKEQEAADWRKVAVRIRNASERLCVDIERGVNEIRSLEQNVEEVVDAIVEGGDVA